MRAIYLTVLLLISSLTAFTQHNSGNNDRSVDGMIPLYDSIITYRMDDFGSPYYPYMLRRNFMYDDAINNVANNLYALSSGNWFHNLTIKMSYNDNNQLTRTTEIEYPNDTVSDNIREYDLNGNRTLYVTWANNDGPLFIVTRITSTYDNNNNELTNTLEKVHNDTLMFIQREVNTYVNNFLETKTILHWDNEWINYRKNLYIRNNEGLDSEMIVQNWLETDWSEYQKYLYTYDEDGTCTQTLIIMQTDSGYIPFLRITQTFIGNKVLTKTNEVFFDQWLMSSMESSEYDANLNLLRFRSYDMIGDNFEIIEDLRQSFDSENIMTSKVWYSYENYDVSPTLGFADSTLYFFKKVPVGIEDTPSATLTIYPNPTKDLIKINSSTPVIKAELYNLSGIRLAQYPANTTEVNLNWLPAGTYVLRTITKQGVHCNKVLVE